jgi:hypothetical protein
MKYPHIFDLYTDYLIANKAQATATSMSAMLDQVVSHDQITRMLSQPELDSRDFWKQVKKTVRLVESPEGIISIDDSIEEKPHSTENDLICWHWDHTKGRQVKGINFISFQYVTQFNEQIAVNLPIAYELVQKTERSVNPTTGKQTRHSPKTKNDLIRERLDVLTFQNHVKYKYILFDIWYGSAENMEFIHNRLKKLFICPLKDNRKLALSKQDKSAKKFIQVYQLDIEPGQNKEVWLKDVGFPVLITKVIYENKDGSTAVQYLITNDTSLNSTSIQTFYQKRWKSEEAHKSSKQNASLADSPTKMERTQGNHFFASMIAMVKLEKLKWASGMNHFQLKNAIYIKALKAAWDELQNVKEQYLITNFNYNPNFRPA